LLFLKKENGSIIVEASLTLPIFLLFVILLTSMVKLGIYEGAVDHATAEATKQIASHVYPVAVVNDMAKNAFENTHVGKQFKYYAETAGDMKAKVDSNVGLLSGIFDSSIGKYYNMPFDKLKSLVNSGIPLTGGAASLFDPVVLHYMDVNLANEEDLKVTKVELPNLLTSGGSPYFGMEVTYKVDLPLPFFKKQIEIKKQAYERVWIGK